jgi:hypothetical protein
MLVVYLDIETTGLEKEQHDITVIALIAQDSRAGHRDFEEIHNVVLDARAGREAHTQGAVCALLNRCDRIVAYNGVFFDIPFLAHWACGGAGSAADAATAAWAAKTLDFFLVAEGMVFARVGMQKMCIDNGMSISKSASGKQAVQWALEEEWEKLESYCMQDVRVLLSLTQFARTNLVCVRGYQRSNAAFGAQGFFRLEQDLTCTVVTPSAAPPLGTAADLLAAFAD